MNRFNAATAVCCLALLSAAIPATARADESNQETTVTFSGPVEIPAVHVKGWGVLPAGTYVFRLLDSQSDRHIVQIFNKDKTVIYATILAIPNYRLKATDKTVITFRERPAGQPEALRAWFYPGRHSGEEFVYPKEKAIALARETHNSVLYTPADVVVEVEELPPAPDAPVVVQLRQAPVRAIQPTGDDVELAQVVTPAPPPGMKVSDDAALPKTASDLPLIAMLGLMSLAGALVVRSAARRVR